MRVTTGREAILELYGILVARTDSLFRLFSRPQRGSRLLAPTRSWSQVRGRTPTPLSRGIPEQYPIRPAALTFLQKESVLDSSDEAGGRAVGGRRQLCKREASMNAMSSETQCPRTSLSQKKKGAFMPATCSSSPLPGRVSAHA